MAALLCTIAKTRNKPSPPTMEWISKWWCGYNMKYLAPRMNRLQLQATTPTTSKGKDRTKAASSTLCRVGKDRLQLPSFYRLYWKEPFIWVRNVCTGTIWNQEHKNRVLAVVSQTFMNSRVYFLLQNQFPRAEPFRGLIQIRC